MKLEITLTINATPEITELLQRLLSGTAPAKPADDKVGIDYYVTEWATDNLTQRNGEMVAASTAYRHYQVWCDTHGIACPAAQKKFGDEMTRLGHQRKKIGGTYRYLHVTFY